MADEKLCIVCNRTAEVHTEQQVFTHALDTQGMTALEPRTDATELPEPGSEAWGEMIAANKAAGWRCGRGLGTGHCDNPDHAQRGAHPDAARAATTAYTSERREVVGPGVALKWLNGYGYRCPRCKLFVTHARSDHPRYCPRCPAVGPASPANNADRLAEIIRNGPEVLDEPDAWAAYLDSQGVLAALLAEQPGGGE